MKLISHRGNMIGPVPGRENAPSYIDTAISAGYEVEIDIRYIDSKFYLGHDTPDYEVSENWINKRKSSLWIHCKNLEAAEFFSRMNDIMFFCHTSDSFVLTSNNYIWVHDLKMNIDDRCIIPLLTDTDISKYKNQLVYAVCTDYINFAEYNLNRRV